MPKRRSFAILGTALLLAGAAPVAHSAPAMPCDPPGACYDVSGTYYDDTVVPAGNYRVRTAIVLGGATLTIEPGTSLYFDPGAEIRTLPDAPGRLIAQGTAEEPVLLTSIGAGPTAGTWRGVSLSGSSGNVLRHVRIESADNGVLLDRADAEISDSTIAVSSEGDAIAFLRVPATARLRVLRNVLTRSGPADLPSTHVGIQVQAEGEGAAETEISGNDVRGFGLGIDVYGVSALISGNNLTSNGIGIRCEAGAPRVEGNTVTGNGSGIAIAGGSPVILDNEITDNRGTGIALSEQLIFPRADPHPAVLNGNRILRNGAASSATYDLMVSVPARFGRVDATQNYWGIENPVRIRARIYDGRDPLNSFYAVADICPYIGHDGEPIECDD